MRSEKGFRDGAEGFLRSVFRFPFRDSSGAWRRRGQFGNGGAIFARIGSAIVDAGAEIAHDRLTAAEGVGIAIVHPEDMPFGLQLGDGVARETIFQLDVTSLEREFRKARRSMAAWIF